MSVCASTPMLAHRPDRAATVAPGLGAGPLPRRAHQGVRRLVTLGTPHLGPKGGRDMTGGTLTWLNNTWPGTAGVRPCVLSRQQPMTQLRQIISHKVC